MLKFPNPVETVPDIMQEMRSVPRSGEFLYRLVDFAVPPVVDVATFRPQLAMRRECSMTLAKLADRLDAAREREKNEIPRLWKALDRMREFMNRYDVCGGNIGNRILEVALAENELKKPGGIP